MSDEKSKGRCKRPHSLHSCQQRPTYDLMVEMPKSSAVESPLLMVKQIQKRLHSTGFTHMALTHTIYGCPRPKEDRAEKTIPEVMLQSAPVKRQKLTHDSARTKSFDDESEKKNQKSTITVLRRLHAVLENSSDVKHYGIHGNSSSKLLQEYDLVSLSPRNDAAFQAACQLATASDIITLDYTAGKGGIQLPFQLRAADVRAVVDRNAVFEIPYAPSIFNKNQRKGMMQACRRLQMASLGLKPRIILGSGSRMDGEDDTGIMALRTPSDLINVMKTVMGYDARISDDALHGSGTYTLYQSRTRRFGPSTVSAVHVAKQSYHQYASSPKSTYKPERKNDKQSQDSAEKNVTEDGFLSLM